MISNCNASGDKFKLIAQRVEEFVPSTNFLSLDIIFFSGTKYFLKRETGTLKYRCQESFGIIFFLR